MHEKSGEPMPDDVVPPDLEPEALHYLDAFDRLSRDRGMTQAGFPLPIPWSSVVRYARVYGIGDLDRFERLSRLIAALDREYGDIIAAERPDPQGRRE
jgi:hypothetical protein